MREPLCYAGKGAERAGVDDLPGQTAAQQDEGQHAADQPGVSAREGDATPQPADHERAGEGGHHAAGTDPDQEGDVHVLHRPGHPGTEDQDDHRAPAADHQDLAVDFLVAQVGAVLGDDRPAVDVVGDDLGRRHDEPVRGRHDRGQDADADQSGQPGREEFDEQGGQSLVRVARRLEKLRAEHAPGQDAAQTEHSHRQTDGEGELDEAHPVAVVLERPDLVADVGQHAERDVGEQHAGDGPPGVVERIRRVERPDQVLVLDAQIGGERAQAAVHPGREEEHDDDDDRDEEHHQALDAVRQDVRVCAAEHHVDEQHAGRDDQRGHRLESEHDLEHDQSRHELSGDVEEQDQGEDGDEQPHAVALVAVAQVFGDRPIAELVA